MTNLPSAASQSLGLSPAVEMLLSVFTMLSQQKEM